MTLTETELHQTLDDRGLLDAAQSRKGAYALELEAPAGTVAAIKQQWKTPAGNRIAPARATLAPMAHKRRLVYVGAAYDTIYRRLCQHANGHKSATVMNVYPPKDVYDIYPGEREFTVATRLSDREICVWTDGRTL